MNSRLITLFPLLTDWLTIKKLSYRHKYIYFQRNLIFIIVACLQRTSDTAVLLTKNEIRAVKKLVFKVVRKTLSIQKMDTDFHSCGVDLASVLVWAIREQRLYSADTMDMEFNIKLDGRPLGGTIFFLSDLHIN